MIGPDIWGIDMTTFKWRGTRYAVWSGWENNGDEFPQHLYIAEMKTPWEINGPRIKLASPYLPWETSIAPIMEGPQVWIKDGMLSILYSANASWTQEYSTGKLILLGTNPLNPEHWARRESPLLVNAGHGCIVDGYMVYHRKQSAWPGWSDRVVESIKL
jgi:GH43 family beta-xylosidase